MVGAAVRKGMRHGAAQAMHTALQFQKGTAAGRRERSLYRVIAAMIMNKKRSRHLWGTPTKLSALYRIWRQVLEDGMQKCITLWMVHQRAEKTGARAFLFFYMGRVITGAQQVSWFYMGNALTSVLAGGALRAISRWQYNTCIATQDSGRRDATRWVTSGVLVFLDKYRRRAARAHIALAAMAAVSQRRGELFPPTEGEHDIPLSDSESDSTMSQGHSEAVYQQRMRDTASAVRYATSVALLKATWRMYTVRRAMQVGKEHIPTQKGMRRYRSLAKANRLIANTAKRRKETVTLLHAGLFPRTSLWSSICTSYLGMPAVYGSEDPVLPILSNSMCRTDAKVIMISRFLAWTTCPRPQSATAR